MLIIAPIAQAETLAYTCGICGFVMNDEGECPRCKLTSEQGLLMSLDDGEGADILDQVAALLSGDATGD